MSGSQTQDAELGQRRGETSFNESFSFGLGPQFLGTVELGVDGLAQTFQKRMRNREIPSPIFPQSRRADADFAGKLR